MAGLRCGGRHARHRVTDTTGPAPVEPMLAPPCLGWCTCLWMSNPSMGNLLHHGGRATDREWPLSHASRRSRARRWRLHRRPPGSPPRIELLPRLINDRTDSEGRHTHVPDPDANAAHALMLHEGANRRHNHPPPTTILACKRSPVYNHKVAKASPRVMTGFLPSSPKRARRGVTYCGRTRWPRRQRAGALRRNGRALPLCLCLCLRLCLCKVRVRGGMVMCVGTGVMVRVGVGMGVGMDVGVDMGVGVGMGMGMDVERGTRMCVLAQASLLESDR